MTDNKQKEKENEVSFHNNETTCPDRYCLLKSFSKELRSQQTEAENQLWIHLRRKGLGVTFRRQHPILDYIVDFICLPKRLIIEVDGGYHNKIDQQINDASRTIRLEGIGYKVIRFTNEQVLSDVQSVLKTIKEQLNS